MMRSIFACFFLYFVVSAQAQMTLNVTVPQYYMPLLEDVYVAGDFNGWEPGDESYRLTLQNNGTYTIAIDGVNGATVNFKFTRGDWDRVEGTATGGYLNNRTISFLNNTTQTFTIEGWEDFPGQSTAVGNTNVLGTRIEIPQLDRTRRVWVYLPPGYENETMHYPVVYMHDGQNLFDAASSFVGEWGVDESMEALPEDCIPAIIVGIDNGGEHRINEYSAWVNNQYGGGEAEAFATFIIETLKPQIDAMFRTLPSRNYTAVMGSSLGGLMAMYMVMEFGEVFGRAGVMSPSFWFTDGVFELAESHDVLPQTRIFMLGGTTESATMVPNMEAMRDILLDRGYTPENIRLEAHSYGQHNETYWSGEFTEVFKWLFADFDASVSESKSEARPFLAPNPAQRSVQILLDLETEAEVLIFGLNGRMVHRDSIRPLGRKNLDLSHLSNGTYIVLMRTSKEVFRDTLIIRN